MKLKLSAAALGLSLFMGLAANATHAASPDDAIKARLACMKSHGAVLKLGAPMVKGEKPFDAAALKAAYDAEDKACADWANMWGADTQKGDKAKTDALPEVWSNAKGFADAQAALVAATPKLRAAADAKGFKAALPAFVGACKACHEKFRRPDG